MQKVIYFDEGSAADILQLEYGGNILSVDEEKGTVHVGSNVAVSAELGAGTSFFTAIKAAFSTKASIDASNARDSLVTKTISNTILSDFANISSKLEKENKLHKFKNFYVKPAKNSFTFIKMYTPYIKLFKEDSSFNEALKDFNIQSFDEVLVNARGYYELLAYKGNENIILRFNINTFKNSYKLIDLPKMKLTYFAIEVGEGKETDLQIEKEMDTEKATRRISVEEVMGDSERNSEEKTLKMYDVILAGVE